MTCNLKDNVLSLFDYSLELSYEEFCKLGKSFKYCDDINDIYELLKNIMHEITISTKNSSLKIKSSIRLNSLFDNEIELVISIPLITGKNEIIQFLFEKKNRDPINLSLISFISKILEL